MLKTAEVLGIYELPPTIDKYSRRSLKRFDAMDVVSLSIDFGKSRLLEDKYPQLITHHKTDLRLIVKITIWNFKTNCT